MCSIEVFEAQLDFISIINQYLKKSNWIGIRMLINKSWLLSRQIKFFGKYMEKQWYKKNIFFYRMTAISRKFLWLLKFLWLQCNTIIITLCRDHSNVQKSNNQIVTKAILSLYKEWL